MVFKPGGSRMWRSWGLFGECMEFIDEPHERFEAVLSIEEDGW